MTPPINPPIGGSVSTNLQTELNYLDKFKIYSILSDLNYLDLFKFYYIFSDLRPPFLVGV